MRELPIAAYDGLSHKRLYVDEFSQWQRVDTDKSFNRFKNVYFDRAREIFEIKFRLPRKLKKKVKSLFIAGRISSYGLKFEYDAYKMAKYYNCKILVEKDGSNAPFTMDKLKSAIDRMPMSVDDVAKRLKARDRVYEYFNTRAQNLMAPYDFLPIDLIK